MALIKCSECGKDVSDKASNCPNCGNPANQVNKTIVQMDTAPHKRRKYRVRILIFMPMFIIGLPLAVFNLFSGDEGRFIVWLLVGVVGFIGTIASAIGSWLAEP